MSGTLTKQLEIMTEPRYRCGWGNRARCCCVRLSTDEAAAHCSWEEAFIIWGWVFVWCVWRIYCCRNWPVTQWWDASWILTQAEDPVLQLQTSLQALVRNHVVLCGALFFNQECLWDRIQVKEHPAILAFHFKLVWTDFMVSVSVVSQNHVCF